MTEQEIRLELAKAFISSGRNTEFSLDDWYGWIMETNFGEDLMKKARKMPIGDIASYLMQKGNKNIVGKLETSFRVNNIKTVGELLDLGRMSFVCKRNVGRKMIYGIDEYLENRFCITCW